ncbi:hypothetical protein SAMN05443246_5804 [Paenibacillus sp. GP183]|nr:hypothetical protein SAMN05443246_5804 [Paenibacillus sp. GP183]
MGVNTGLNIFSMLCLSLVQVSLKSLFAHS